LNRYAIVDPGCEKKGDRRFAPFRPSVGLLR